MRFLIVGQGIAGSVLAWTLLQRGAKVQLADPKLRSSSSRVAAGIINPVTGKRFVKSWNFDLFYPVARATYQAMERDLGARLWYDVEIFRLLGSAGELNDWAARQASPGYENLLSIRQEAGSWSAQLHPPFAIGAIRQAARVDFTALLKQLGEKRTRSGAFLPAQLQPEQVLEKLSDFDAVILCQGADATASPFFPNLPWQLSKGEALLLDLKGPEPRELLKKNLMLAPLGNGKIWAGATSVWNFSDGAASESGRADIEQRLQEILRVNYQVIDHLAAIRPTVLDRRPFLGASREYPNLFIFNGLGTKGALLAPYWAVHLADHLLEGKTLDAEVDIRRFAAG